MNITLSKNIYIDSMNTILYAWIGKTDLRAIVDSATVGFGPIAQAVKTGTFAKVHLLTDSSKSDWKTYQHWLAEITGIKAQVHEVELKGPTDFASIYQAVRSVLSEVDDAGGKGCQRVFHLSPGTPAMASVWILTAKSRFPAKLIESSKEHGVKEVHIPFDLTAEFLPDLFAAPDKRLKELSASGLPEHVAFAQIIHRSPIMKRLIARAHKVALRSVPVLIEGESGTGKELLSRAIHDASPRKAQPFIAVNCGAIPKELVESEFFGHEKGAFTGANSTREGHFEKAHGGTLFLDELGELPLAVQVKLLRVLQEGEVVRLGASKPIKVDVRIVAATNKDMAQEVADGRFREDLFYRIAVAILKLPPLREREGDIGLLVDQLLERVNAESKADPGYQHKKIHVKGRNLLLQRDWPGNVRELLNTLRRAALWSDGDTISVQDIEESLIQMPQASSKRGVLDRPLENGVDLPELMGQVARHYLERALKESGGQKTKTAELLGLGSYQTLGNWMERYGVKS